MKPSIHLHNIVLSLCIFLISIFTQADNNPKQTKQLNLDYQIDNIYNTTEGLLNNTQDYFWDIYKTKSEIVLNDLKQMFANYKVLPKTIICSNSSPFFSSINKFATKNIKDLSLSAKTDKREIDEFKRLKNAYKQNCQTAAANNGKGKDKFLKLISELFVFSRVTEARQNLINETITKNFGIIITLNNDNTVSIKTNGSENTLNNPIATTPAAHMSNIGLFDNTNITVGKSSLKDKGATDPSEIIPADVSEEIKPGIK